jgi:hypothetical protein
MAKKKKSDPQWWNTEGAEMCYEKYLTMIIFDENPSCIKSQLVACNTILKRFSNIYDAERVQRIEYEIEILQHRIAGTYEKYMAEQNAQAAAYARRVLDFINNDHQRVCRKCLKEFTCKGMFPICPGCGDTQGIAISPDSPECNSYDAVVKFINAEKMKFGKEVKNDKAV